MLVFVWIKWAFYCKCFANNFQVNAWRLIPMSYFSWMVCAGNLFHLVVLVLLVGGQEAYWWEDVGDSAIVRRLYSLRCHGCHTLESTSPSSSDFEAFFVNFGHLKFEEKKDFCIKKSFLKNWFFWCFFLSFLSMHYQKTSNKNLKHFWALKKFEEIVLDVEKTSNRRLLDIYLTRCLIDITRFSLCTVNDMSLHDLPFVANTLFYDKHA